MMCTYNYDHDETSKDIQSMVYGCQGTEKSASREAESPVSKGVQSAE